MPSKTWMTFTQFSDTELKIDSRKTAAFEWFDVPATGTSLSETERVFFVCIDCTRRVVMTNYTNRMGMWQAGGKPGKPSSRCQVKMKSASSLRVKSVPI